MLALVYFDSGVEEIQRQIARTWHEDAPARALRVKCSVTLEASIPDRALGDDYFPNTLIRDRKQSPAKWKGHPEARWEEEIARRGAKSYFKGQFYSPLDAGPRPTSVMLFDGHASWRYQPRTMKPYATKYAGLSPMSRLIQDYYGDAIGFPSVVQGKARNVAGDIGEPYQLDQIFTTGQYRLLGEESVQGVACAVLERPGLDKLWLAVGMGYVIVRRDWCWTVNGPIKRRITNREFRQMGPGIWIPGQVEMEVFGHPSSNPNRRVGVLRLHVVEAEVDVADTWFEPHFPDGTAITDTISGEVYVQGEPAESALDAVSERLVRYRGDFVRRSWWQSPSIWAGVFLGIIIAIALMIYRLSLGRRARDPRGVTLVETLVILAIIGLLVLFLLPAVQNARRAAARACCANNLRQIGTALHQYEGEFGQLPAGRPTPIGPNFHDTARSVFVAILPYVDAQVVYNQYNFSLPGRALANLTVDVARPGIFVCPSDSDTGRIVFGAPRFRQPSPDPPHGTWPMALASYGFMYGTLHYPWELGAGSPDDPYRQINGCFNDLQRITLADITDGLSQTMFATERALTYINTDRIHPWGHWVGTLTPSTLLYATFPPNTMFKISPRDYRIARVCESSSSYHPGGANVLLGDSSVRFVSETVNSWPIDPELLVPVGIGMFPGGFRNVPAQGVWQSLATRAGGEVIGEF